MNRPNSGAMRRVRTIQTLINATVPKDRAQLSSAIARLEHERARLGRERSIWMHKQMLIDERLRDIQARLDRMQALLNPRQEPAGQSAPASARLDEEQKATSGKAYKTVTLEY